VDQGTGINLQELEFHVDGGMKTMSTSSILSTRREELKRAAAEGGRGAMCSPGKRWRANVEGRFSTVLMNDGVKRLVDEI
jgi:hypothetical protein